MRTVLFATGTVLSYVQSAFVPLAAYPASEAPEWRIGAKLYLGFACVAAVMYCAIAWAFKWEERSRNVRKEVLRSETDVEVDKNT